MRKRLLAVRSQQWVRRCSFPAFLSVYAVATAAAQQTQSDVVLRPPSYQSLRYLEDWSVMRDSSRRLDWSDQLKYIPLGNREGRYMSIGGELRPFYERYRNEEWG